jgi:hypothetical protein
MPDDDAERGLDSGRRKADGDETPQLHANKASAAPEPDEQQPVEPAKPGRKRKASSALALVELAEVPGQDGDHHHRSFAAYRSPDMDKGDDEPPDGEQGNALVRYRF